MGRILNCLVAGAGNAHDKEKLFSGLDSIIASKFADGAAIYDTGSSPALKEYAQSRGCAYRSLDGKDPAQAQKFLYQFQSRTCVICGAGRRDRALEKHRKMASKYYTEVIALAA